MTFFTELKRRNVFKVGIAYIVVGWLIMQVAEILVPALRLPDWALTATLYFLAIGFLPVLVFAWAFELTPEGIRLEKDVDRSQSISSKTGRKLDFLIIGLLIVAVAFLAWNRFSPQAVAPESPTAAEGPGQTDTPPALPAKSVAVLPFVNMSEDPSNEYFSDGVSEEILNALAQVRDIKVAGRTSSFAFKGHNEDLRLIGQTLNVSHVLEGSVRKAGNTVRITAQLIDVKDGYHEWSQTWDRELEDVFAIQDEIASAIVHALKAELVGGEEIASSRTDPRAYEKYLQARDLMRTRARPDLEQAASLLDQAIELDEGFAPAWAQRGIVSILLSDQQYGTLPFADALTLAHRYLEQALAIDDRLAEGLAGMGLYYLLQPGPENLGPARENLERALTINPNMINASNWLYSVLVDENRAADALDLLERMFERDPLYPPLIGNLPMAYFRMGTPEKLAPVLERLRPFMGDTPYFKMAEAQFHTSQGDNAGALPLAEAAFEAAPESAFTVNTLARTLYFLNDFERELSLPIKAAWPRNLSLLYLGRVEEATMLARQDFQATHLPDTLIQTLAHSGQYEAVIRLVEQDWTTVEQFHQQQKPALGFGNANLIYIAYACLKTGRAQQFETAMRLARDDHDRQIAAGIGWPMFYLMEAQYWALANDHEQATEFLRKAADSHLVIAPRISRMYPIFKPLEGEPEYEAVQKRMLENLNKQRAEAGLQPLEAEYGL